MVNRKEEIVITKWWHTLAAPKSCCMEGCSEVGAGEAGWSFLLSQVFCLFMSPLMVLSCIPQKKSRLGVCDSCLVRFCFHIWFMHRLIGGHSGKENPIRS